MSFQPYESIKNHYHSISVDTIKSLGFDDPEIEWVATEKIHGSNFCMIYIPDEDLIQCGRRRAILEEDESFFNWRNIRDKYRENIIDIAQKLSEKFGTVGNIYIYGELYGGSYVHPEVERVDGVKAIQSGISYRPDVDFYPFDIKTEEHGYLSYDILSELCEGNFIYANELYRGTFEECFAYDVEFNSLLPSILGLPEIDQNIAEGIVLKPVVPKYTEEGERIILKKKHPNFSEIQSKPKPKKKAKKKQSTPINEEAQEFIDILDGYITENRLRNVISKEGEIEDSKSSKATLVNLYKADILEDFKEDNPLYESAPGNVTKFVNIHLQKSAPQMVGKNWDAIVSSTF